MSFSELFLLAVGLAMDAFAVSVCKGLSIGKVKLIHMLKAGLWFGGFQALMPLLGYLLGTTFEQYVKAYSHWIAFALLLFLGAKMIKEAFDKEENDADSSFGVKTMLIMAVATSIDALAVGIPFATLPDVNIPVAISLIGIVTFIISASGVKIGSVFGDRYKLKAELAGGIILILLGIKILLTAYNII